MALHLHWKGLVDELFHGGLWQKHIYLLDRMRDNFGSATVPEPAITCLTYAKLHDYKPRQILIMHKTWILPTKVKASFGLNPRNRWIPKSVTLSRKQEFIKQLEDFICPWHIIELWWMYARPLIRSWIRETITDFLKEMCASERISYDRKCKLGISIYSEML